MHRSQCSVASGTNEKYYQNCCTGEKRELKFSMMLFHRADPKCELFSDVLKKYYNGEEDWKTLSLLGVVK